MHGIAYVDLESTGLTAKDRAVEIGVVLMTPDGDIEDTFTTLINPHRHIDAGHIHGVTATDLVRAPDFDTLAPYLAQMLAGRLLVAHNAWFDLTLLAREYGRTGLPFPDAVPAVCTMRMCSSLLGSVRSLAMACEYLSIDSGASHCAADDALAGAEIFRRLVFDYADPSVVEGAGTFYWRGQSGQLIAERHGLHSLLGRAAQSWYAEPPTFHGGATGVPPCCTRGQAAAVQREADGRIARLISRLPADTSAAGWASVEYLALLDVVLLDRLVTEAEALELASLADELGLTAAAAEATHRHYVERLAQAALRDGVVTDDERADLQRVCDLLALDRAILDELLAAEPSLDSPAAPAGLMFEVGDRVTFTGETTPSRSVLEGIARAAGLDVGGVTKKSRALVAADPNSESGKARKARDYGVPVISTQVFLYAVEDLRGATRSDNGVEW